jgi:hypothetical protein
VITGGSPSSVCPEAETGPDAVIDIHGPAWDPQALQPAGITAEQLPELVATTRWVVGGAINNGGVVLQ